MEAVSKNLLQLTSYSVVWRFNIYLRYVSEDAYLRSVGKLFQELSCRTTELRSA